LRSYYYADHVLTISDLDRRAILRARPPGRRMHAARFSTVRHVYADPPLFAFKHRPGFGGRVGLLFVGNMNNPTNLYGLRWFVRVVLPLIRRQEPTLRLRVVGAWDGQDASRSGVLDLLRSQDGVDVLGYVKDLAAELRRARVFVVPVRWATGILTKQSLAHVHGVPTATTPAAARHNAPAPLDMLGRALVWSHRLGDYETAQVALVAEAADAFAAAVLELHHNESLWNQVSLNAARFAKSGGRKSICPETLLDDLHDFWRKLHSTLCT